MNRERMKELLPVMKAFSEGKTVQMRATARDEWLSALCPRWEDGREYRIKPDPPRSIFLIEREDGTIYSVTHSRENADRTLREAQLAYPTRKYKLVEYVEKVEG